MLPEWVVSIGYLKEFSPSPVQLSAEFMIFFPKSTVESQYFTSTEVKPKTGNVLPSMAFLGWMALRADSLTRGSNQT